MSPIVFVKGTPKKFIAMNEFSLNLENKLSAKIRKGDVVEYDGVIATYKKPNGDIMTGPSSSLKHAINAHNWLIPIQLYKPEAPPIIAGESQEPVQIPVEKTVDSSRRAVIREDDLIVKNVSSKKQQSSQKTSEKLEVALDQVEVKDVRRTVTSSTMSPRTSQRKMTVVAADEMGADSTTPIKNRSHTAAKPNTKKSFTVDHMTPLPSEDMTKDEIQRMTQKTPETEMTSTSDGQEAVVLKKPRAKMDVVPMDGVPTGGEGDQNQGAIVVKKVSAPKTEAREVEGITLKKYGPAPDMNATAKVSGSSNVEINTKATYTPSEPMTNQEAVVVNRQASVTREDPPDYLSILPDDWGKMHWVQKEKWIKAQTNKGLLEFLLTVETIAAIVNACKERIAELEQAGPGA